MQNNRNKRKKILVVDDDNLHLHATKELLENDHYEVITHRKNNYGIGVTNLVREFQPDLVLLDINMPGLSGDKLAKLLRWRDTPFMFYSSNDEDSLRDSASLYGAKGYICKGNIGDLRNKVERYLSGLTALDDVSIRG